MQVTISRNPNENCFWVTDFLLFGEPIDETQTSIVSNCQIRKIYNIEDILFTGKFRNDKVLTQQNLENAINILFEGNTIESVRQTVSLRAMRTSFHTTTTVSFINKVKYLNKPQEYNRNIYVILGCVLKRYMKIHDEKYILQFLMRIMPFSLVPKDENEILNGYIRNYIKCYQYPKTVIFCGDRSSSFSFIDIIKKCIKELPSQSTIVHGHCKGIDKLSGELAEKFGYNVKKYPVSREDWANYGYSAGPRRNREMLKELPDLIYAFHPDIKFSKGTKDMMTVGYQNKIPVYLFDTKNKIKFEGSFDDLYR